MVLFKPKGMINCRFARYFSAFILLVSFSVYLSAQSRIDLEKKKYKVQQEIELAAKLLNETESSRKITINKLQLITTKVTAREKMITNFNVEIELINSNIQSKEELISEMEADLTEIKAEYARLIQYTFIFRKSYDGLMYLLASENINQLYKRVKFIQQLSSFRKKEALALEDTKESLQNVVNELESLKREKSVTLKGVQREQYNLKSEQRQQNIYFNSLRKKEKELRAQIVKKNEVAKRLEAEINTIVENEARKRKSRNANDEMTPEEKLVSKNFQDNKGKLPWPTETGMIISSFGEHPHPVLKDVKTRNHGVDISTSKNSYVRCVFGGEVSKVIAIPGTNYTVIIRHGSFLSVYQNLVDIKVKNGEKVKTKEIIGRVYSNPDDNSSILHFELWNETEKQNPEDWLSRK